MGCDGGLLLHFIQHADGAVYAVFEGTCGSVDGALRNGYEAGKLGDVGWVALEPAGFGEAVMPFAVVFGCGQDAVGEAGVPEFFGQVVGVFESCWVTEGYGCLYLAPAASDRERQPCGCFVLYAVRGHELRFDDYGCAVGGGDEDVGLQCLVAGDGLRAFGADVAAVHHAAQNVGEGVVCRWFGGRGIVVSFWIGI